MTYSHKLTATVFNGLTGTTCYRMSFFSLVYTFYFRNTTFIFQANGSNSQLLLLSTVHFNFFDFHLQVKFGESIFKDF